jgi:ribosome maturation protein Sdo1
MQVVKDAMDLQVVQHEPMQMVDQAMEEVHVAEVITTPKKVISARN